MRHARTQGRRALFALAGVAALMLTACTSGGAMQLDTNPDKPFVLEGVSNVTEIAKLTGPEAINNTEAVSVAGTDLGWMVDVGEEMLFVFGDTFGERDPESYGGQGGFWRSNVAAFSTDTDPTDGITFDRWHVDDLGLAEALIEGDHDGNDAGGEVTKIPTGGFVIDGNIYVGFMSVRHWGDAGAWDANYAGLIVSRDNGETWERVEGVEWPGDSNFIQITSAQIAEGGKNWVYLWAIPSGRFGGVKLMRVEASPDAVEDLGSYEYFAGLEGEDPVWSSNLEEAELIIPPTVGEHSVMWSDYLDRWIMTYSDIGNAYIREGVTPWGPWGDAIELVSVDDYHGLYSPYMHPKYVSDDGRTVYFTMSLWGPYNVYWFSMDLDRKQ